MYHVYKNIVVQDHITYLVDPEKKEIRYENGDLFLTFEQLEICKYRVALLLKESE